MARIRRLNLLELDLAERHARREDPKSRARQVRMAAPVTWTPAGIDTDPLALVQRYNDHVEGAFIPKSRAKALHMLVKFPESVAVDTRVDAEKALSLAIEFAKDIFGDDAVFAARMDRDEKSLTNADLFIAPRYVKKTKHTEKVAVSLTRHLKLMAEESGPLPQDKDILRAQGQALQDAFAKFLRGRGYQALRGQPKAGREPDWSSPEAYGVGKDREIIEAGREANRIEQDYLDARREEFERSASTRDEDIEARITAAEMQSAEAARLLAEGRDAIAEGNRLLEQAKTARAQVAEQRRLVDEAAEEQARRGKLLGEREEHARAEREQIESERQQLVGDHRTLDRRSDALDAREADVWAREGAVADREAAVAQGNIDLADEKRRIAKAQADAIEVLAQATLEANATRQAASADRDKARRSALAAVVADEQLALVARAAEDDGLELRLAEDERGVSMNEAAMTTSERDAYCEPWSKMVRGIARAVASMLGKLREQLASALAAKRKLDADAVRLRAELKDVATQRVALEAQTEKVIAAQYLAKSDKAAAARMLERAKLAAQAWKNIPDDERPPQVEKALRLTGVAEQAASLPPGTHGSSKGPVHEKDALPDPSRPRER